MISEGQIQQPATHIQLPVSSAVQSKLTAAWAMTHSSLPPWEHSCCQAKQRHSTEHIGRTCLSHRKKNPGRQGCNFQWSANCQTSNIPQDLECPPVVTAETAWFMVPEARMSCAKWWWIWGLVCYYYFFSGKLQGRIKGMTANNNGGNCFPDLQTLTAEPALGLGAISVVKSTHSSSRGAGFRSHVAQHLTGAYTPISKGSDRLFRLLSVPLPKTHTLSISK